VPKGVDPHNFQLTPRSLELLRRADLIISTAHTPFEIAIRRLVMEGYLSARLLEIPKISGIRLLKIPGTSILNLHMPIYDPFNYEKFITALALELSNLKPSDKYTYLTRAKVVIKGINSLIKESVKLNVYAIADFPFIQYAVSWLNVTVKYSVLKEWNLPPTPKELIFIRNALKSREINLVLITEPSDAKATKYLKELAERYGVPAIYVPSPLAEGSILSKLRAIASQVKVLAAKAKPR